MLLTGLLALQLVAPTRGQALAADMEIGVRAGVDQAEKAKRDQDPGYAQERLRHPRLYFLARVTEEKSDVKLIRPMDAGALAEEVRRALASQGFRPAGPNETPEIVVTVKYGRGVIPNPYINPDFLSPRDPRKFDKLYNNLSNSDTASTIVAHESFVGLEAKAEAIGAEKLVIQIRAWKYPPPTERKKKVDLAWMTTVYTDDPDHRDLNQISAKLLERAAPYFDQHIDREKEVVMHTRMPEGHVNVGTPEVVPEGKK